VADSCVHGNEPPDSVKGGQFFNQLRVFKLFKKD